MSIYSLFGDDSGGGGGGGISVSPGVWDTAIGMNSDFEWDTPRTPATATTDAIGSMTPVSTGGGRASEWDGFWSSTLKGVLGYAIQKDAVQSGVLPARPSGYTATGQPVYSNARPAMGNLMPLLVVGGLIFLAVRK